MNSYAELKAELARWTFMPNYRLEMQILTPAVVGGMRMHEHDAAVLIIHSKVLNSRQPDETIDVQAHYPVPPLEFFSRHSGYFTEWLRYTVHDRVRHEVDEWLKRDGVMVFDPHAANK